MIRTARTLLLVVGFGAAALALGGCPKEHAGSPADAGASAADAGAADATADAQARIPTAAEGRALVTGACLSCHTESMLAQQRLTQAQWTKTVTKMVGWGAPLGADEVAPLALYLSSTYGSDAGPFAPETISAAAAAAELSALDDGAFASGDAEHGRTLFVDKCSVCHGQDARGNIGVLLIDRPILYRAADLAKTVRTGRGKMAPLPLTDREIADVIAHLRTLRNAVP